MWAGGAAPDRTGEARATKSLVMFKLMVSPNEHSTGGTSQGGQDWTAGSLGFRILLPATRTPSWTATPPR